MEPYELGVFRVGDCIPPLAIHANGCMATFISGTLFLYTLVYRSNNSLLSAADVLTNGLRLGLYAYDNVMMFALKVGALDWQDAPYTPHLDVESELPANNPFPKGYGMSANHILVDSFDGRILQIKPFVLSTRFSNYLINTIYTLKQEPFNRSGYAATVNYIQQCYSPRELGLRVAQDYFHLPPHTN